MAYLIHINLVDAATGVAKPLTMISGAHFASLGAFPQGIRVGLRELDVVEGQPDTIHLALNFQDAPPLPANHPQPAMFGAWHYELNVERRDSNGTVIESLETCGAHDFVMAASATPVSLEIQQLPANNNFADRFLAILK